MGIGTEAIGKTDGVRRARFERQRPPGRDASAPIGEVRDPWARAAPRMVIASATGIAARLRRVEDRIGTVAPGAFSDLVVDGDPPGELASMTGQGRHMPLIMEGGEAVKRAAW